MMVKLNLPYRSIDLFIDGDFITSTDKSRTGDSARAILARTAKVEVSRITWQYTSKRKVRA